MKNKTLEYLAASVVSVVIAGLVAWAISDGAASAGGFKVPVLCAIWAFALNWIVFVPSWIAKTEHYFDLTGAATYLSVIVVALVLADDLDARSVLIAALVIVWASRLGLFLFQRVRQTGKDGRFDKMDDRFDLMEQRTEDRFVLLEQKVDRRFGWQTFLMVVLGVVTVLNDQLGQLFGV